MEIMEIISSPGVPDGLEPIIGFRLPHAEASCELRRDTESFVVFF